MPGFQGSIKREDTLPVRISPAKKAAWSEYSEKAGFYLSELVRMAVDQFIQEHPDPAKVRAKRWDFRERE